MCCSNPYPWCVTAKLRGCDGERECGCRQRECNAHFWLVCEEQEVTGSVAHGVLLVFVPVPALLAHKKLCCRMQTGHAVPDCSGDSKAGSLAVL